MRPGLYEKLITARLAAELEELQDRFTVTKGVVDEAIAPEVLARHLAKSLVRHLASDEGPSRVNEILRALEDEDDELLPEDELAELLALSPTAGLGAGRQYTRRPSTRLSEAALLTNAQGEPSIGGELRNELATADRVDLLCAFVMWPGIRVIEDQLRGLKDHGVPIRVITSTYTGCTDRGALDRLVTEYGAEVKVHYETSRTRLHAKAWIFHRDSGYGTGFVGSSNLSSSALLDGVEWNVRISDIATPTLMRKFEATFDSYWANPAFETYDPSRDRERLDSALLTASGRQQSEGISLSSLEVTARPHQARMLEELEAHRTIHGRHRNLVIAATGTGKTVVAALDYKRMCSGSNRPRLLFVAHRREILEQARRTYAEVLRDPNFGELLVDGHRPVHNTHVFASVQSLATTDLTTVDPKAYDVIVIDEFHHASAPTYRRILDHFEPRELLGLTATPERADGQDVREVFFDGHAATELRLWDALEEDLLTPFHYFVVGDTVDLTSVKWLGSRGTYDRAELSQLLETNAERAAHVLRSVEAKVGDLDAMKALGFCVSLEHARFMAQFFTASGVPSMHVTSAADSADRGEAQRRLRDGEIKAIFTVDMFNEGVDIPAVNTVLFLRPTESPTVFVQQLGRGLRLANDKPVLTALDFVGHQRKEYRWDRKLRAVAKTIKRTELTKAIDGAGIPLPAGSQIVFDRVARDIVVKNIKAGVSGGWQSLVREARETRPDSLCAFLDDSGLDLADLYTNNKSWTLLRREAGLLPREGSALERDLLKRVRAFMHVDDVERSRAYREVLRDGFTWEAGSDAARRYAPMLTMALFPRGGYASARDAVAALGPEVEFRRELTTVLEMALENATYLTRPMDGRLGTLPLALHARYTREELLTAIGYASYDEKRFPSAAVAGVYHRPEQALDAFLVTTNKVGSGFSPTTMYRDYAISRGLFHWESQGVTREDSATGQRYIHHAERGSSIALFVREYKVDVFGGGAPYVYLGDASYVRHEGERPMAITWKLTQPMPEQVFQWASAV